jgi:hypothetical protein
MEGWVDTTALLEAAREQGDEVTARSLELWRYRGLLPRGERHSQGRAVWLYPPVAVDQLLRLLCWRKQTRSHDLIRIALWVDGFDMDLDTIRGSLAAFSGALWRAVIQELAHDDPAAGLESLARKLANRRGKFAIPRVVRMSADERTRACAAALAYAFQLDSEMAKRQDDLVLFERMLGLRSGHNGGLVAAMTPGDIPTLVPKLPSPSQLDASLQNASPEALELARRVTRMTVVWVPLVLPGVLESYGAQAQPVLRMTEEMFSNISPTYYAFSLTLILLALTAGGPNIEDLRGQLAEFTPGAVGVEFLKMLPAGDRANAFHSVPPPERRAVAAEIEKRKRDEAHAKPSR